MALVSAKGKPHGFTTMTCNANWAEIQRELLPGQTAADHPELVARVFAAKLKQLIHDLHEGQFFGKVIGRVHVIEFQKRGLPHAHVLFILDDEEALHNCDDYDSMVCAEIPDEKTQSDLFRIVTNFMMHGPCGALDQTRPCTEDGICTKGYPKEFRETTMQNEDGVPLYRRCVAKSY